MGESGVGGSSWLRRSSGPAGCVPCVARGRPCSLRPGRCVQNGVRGVPCVARGRWCSLRYWNRRVRRCIKMCVSSSCAADNDNAQAEQPSAQASLHDDTTVEIPPQITVQDLDTLLDHITAEFQRLSQSTSSSSSRLYDTLSHWKQRKESLTTFMKSLPNQVINEVVEPSKDLFNELLIKVIGGVGQEHWIGLGLSIIAWSLENINLTEQNRQEGLEVLDQTIRLLKNTKQIWVYIRTKDGSTSYVHDLQQTIEKAFQCAIICTSNLNDKYILRFLKALNVQGAMATLKEELSRANNQNMELMLRYKLCDTSELERQPVYSNTHDKDRVGGVEFANEAMAFLKQDSDEIIAVCLHGMGGIGKSFTALEIFTQIQESNHCEKGLHYKECRVELEFDIKADKLKDIQRQILDKVSGQKTAFSNTLDGKQILVEKLKKIKEPIFLYLDNILKVEDLDEILPEANSCFPPKSRILVTSRYEYIKDGIAKLGIREGNIKAIEVRGLQENLARELLWKQITSIEKHKGDVNIDDSCKKLEEAVLRLCGGLPLALKVVGGYIASDRNGPKDARVWQDVVDSMQKAQSLSGGAEDDLFSSLRFSLDKLNEAAKKAFLDMVSFYAVDDSWRILKSLVGHKFMKVLKERALVQKLPKTSTSEQQMSIGKIHDLLRAIGNRMIAEDKNELRIAGKEEFDNLQLKEHNIEKVVALKEVTLEACVLKRMPLLRFLRDVKMKGECPEAQLRHLAVVHYMHCKTGNPFSFRECACLKAVTWGLEFRGGGGAVVNAFNLDVLRHEQISKGLEILSIQSWPKLKNVDAIESFGRLRELRLTFLSHLECLPKGITSLTCLKRMSLLRCSILQSLPEGIAELTGLTSLDLGWCECLQALPEGIGNLTGLTELNLHWCESLQALPEGIGNLTGLTELDLRWCESLQALPQGVGNLSGLTSLNMGACRKLQYLPEEITRLNNLKIVDLSDCTSLPSLPKGFAGLQELRIECTEIIAELECLACSQCLWKLSFSCAGILLPQEISMLACSLTELNLVSCQSLRSIDGIATLVRLTSLGLHSCKDLQSIEGITALVCLRDLSLSNCRSLQQLPQGISRATNLTSLQVSSCEKLRCIPEEIGSLMRLTELRLRWCWSLESLPRAIGGLTGLTMLDVEGCTSLQALPEEVAGLLGLRYLGLPSWKNLQHLPDGLSKLRGLNMSVNFSESESLQCLPAGIAILTDLTSLDFDFCKNLKSLPQEIARLELVEDLKLFNCSALQALPEGVAGMRGLKSMDLRYCESLEFLPQGITNLSGLESLKLYGCTSLRALPQGISSLIRLKELDLSRCTRLEPQIFVEEIFCLTCLESLALRGLEKIKVIPAQGLASMTSLEYLSLSECTSLVSLPEELANLKYLEYLDLERCESLKSLPQGISSLTQLQILDLTGCKGLFSLPQGVKKLAVNCEIRLSGCPASMPL